mgnify:FL=1
MPILLRPDAMKPPTSTHDETGLTGLGTTPRSSIDWGAYRVFLTYASMRNREAAALACGISEATLKRRLDQLEASLNTKLFAGHGAGFQLTDFGKVVFGILEQANEVLENGRIHGSRQIRKKVTIATTQGALDYVLTRFFSAYPEFLERMNIALVIPQTSEVSQFEEFDIALSPYAPSNLYGRSEPVGDSKYDFFCSADYAEKLGVPGPDDLGSHKFVFPRKSNFSFASSSYLIALDLKCQSSIRVPTFTDGEKLVKAGVGFGLLNQRFDQPGMIKLSGFQTVEQKVYLNMSAAAQNDVMIEELYDRILEFMLGYFTSSNLG